MNILCNQKKLSNAISIAQKAINSKNTIELLRGILLTAENNTLKITGYDNEFSIETSIEASVNIEGSVVVNSRVIGDIVRKIPETIISIRTDEYNNLFIDWNKSNSESNYKIKYISPEDYPRLPEINAENMVEFQQLEFKNMIKQTVFARSIENINPVLSGELIEIENNELSLVALDGYRLAIRKSNIENGSDFKAIVPGMTLNQLHSLLKDDSTLLIGADDKNIIFNMSETKIVARLIEGNFTKYNSLLPKESNINIKVERLIMQEAIDRASVLIYGDKNNLIKLNIKENLLVITSNSENGNAYEEIPIEYKGDEMEIGFNSKYLIEGIKYIESEYIELMFTGPLNPCVIKTVDDVEYIYLLLPVRINN